MTVIGGGGWVRGGGETGDYRAAVERVRGSANKDRITIESFKKKKQGENGKCLVERRVVEVVVVEGEFGQGLTASGGRTQSFPLH